MKCKSIFFRQYGEKLFDDEGRLQMETAFGSITDDSLVDAIKDGTFYCS